MTKHQQLVEAARIKRDQAQRRLDEFYKAHDEAIDAYHQLCEDLGKATREYSKLLCEGVEVKKEKIDYVPQGLKY